MKVVRGNQWPPELDFLDQEERFRRSLTGNVLPPAEVIGHRSIPERSRRFDKKAYDEAMDMQRRAGKRAWKMDMIRDGYLGSDNDSASELENFIEWVDPTGLYSTDDAARAYMEWKLSGEDAPTLRQVSDMLTAVPLGGKIIKTGKAARDLTKLEKAYNMVINTLNANQALNQINESHRNALARQNQNKQ